MPSEYRKDSGEGNEIRAELLTVSGHANKVGAKKIQDNKSS